MSEQVVWGWEWFDRLSPEVRACVPEAEKQRIRYAKKTGKYYKPRPTECADCGTDISKRYANAKRCVPCSNKRHAELVRRRQEYLKRER